MAIKCIDGKWYAFEQKGDQVLSIGKDNPKNGGRWSASYCDNGIKYVSNPSPSKRAAYSKSRRAEMK